MEGKIAHLGFIQGIITRMGGNSFLLKGWSVTLVAALFALAAKDTNKHYLVLAYFPVLMFWGLDAFFLRTEKLYRKLYDQVARNEIASEHFTLTITADLSSAVDGIGSCFLSKTLFPFYFVIAFVITATSYF